jgi:hypothetical protein
MFCEIILFTGSIYLLASGIRGCFQQQLDFLVGYDDGEDGEGAEDGSGAEEGSDTDSLDEGMRGLVKDFLKKEKKRRLYMSLPRRPHLPEDECAICIGQEGTDVRVLPCGHVFCEICLFEWFDKGVFLCPLCRHTVKMV